MQQAYNFVSGDARDRCYNDGVTVTRGSDGLSNRYQPVSIDWQHEKCRLLFIRGNDINSKDVSAASIDGHELAAVVSIDAVIAAVADASAMLISEPKML